MRRAVVAVVLAGLCLLALAGGAGALTPPSGFLDTTAISGLTKPTSMVWDPSSARLFVTEQNGTLRVVDGGKLLSTPFVTLSVDPNGERGLLGVELDPNFSSNHFLYLYYTVPGTPAHNRVSRFTANGNVAQAGSEQVLLDLNGLQACCTNHNGGALHFGADGKLYVAVGDNANGTNSQTLSGGNLLGKILRMSSDGSIPADNPFSGSLTGNSRYIWAYGLRNPFTFGVQPGTGRIFLDDVGQSTYEEINDGIAGKNYGWPNAEGPANPPNASYTDPLFCYRHSTGSSNCNSTNLTGCAITGGTFYNPSAVSFPAQYVGRYFFSDLCSGWISQLDPGNGNAVSSFATGGSSPVDLDVGPDGALYYLEDGSRVGRISYKAPPTVTTFAPSSGAVGSTVTIDGTYLAGATFVKFNGTSAAFAVVLDSRLVATVPSGATDGQISVTTGSGSATSAGSFTVTGGSPPPAVSISGFTPTSGKVGANVTVSGSGFTGATAVKFNGTNAKSFKVNSDTTIVAQPANGTTNGPIAVTAPGGTATSSGNFTVVPTPTVTSFTPTSGPVGTSVTVNGTNFTGATAVKFSNTAATAFTVNSATQITATVPTGAKTGKIAVTTAGGNGSSSGNFTVTTVAAASLTSNPTSISAGGSVTVSWANVSGPTTMDWIGLFTPGAANTAPLSRIFDSSCTKNAGSTAKASGSCSFSMPTTAGTYQFRLLANNGYTVIATSGNVTVTGSGGGGPAVTTNVSSVSPGGSVTVSWSGVSGPAVKDWLGRYTPGAANTAYLDWKYTSSCTQTAGGTAKASGSCSFTISTAGTYQFRLLANDGYTLIATSGTVTVS